MPTTYLAKVQTWEALWATYVAKGTRLDELTAAGRYGYQLRMPKLSLRRAARALRDWCNANAVDVPLCVTEG